MTICDYCLKEKQDNEVTLMQEGAGIKRSNNSRITEDKIRDWVEFHTGKKIGLFARICFDCQRNESFRTILHN